MTGHEDDDEIRWAEQLSSLLADFFRDIPDKAMLVKWTLQAEVIDQDGGRATWTIAMPGMPIWEKAGMTRYALKYYDWIQEKANEEGGE